MKRSFKFQGLTAAGTPQPVFGTTLTVACGPVGTERSSLQSIAVADSSWFIQKDWIILNPESSTLQERLLVQSIPDSTHIKVQGMQHSHASGVYVQLASVCLSVFIQLNTGNTSPIVIGTSPVMVKATGVFCLVELYQNAAGQPISWSDPQYGAVDGMTAADYWFDGTTNGDALLPSLTVL